MYSAKLSLRDSIIDKKKQYSNTSNQKFMIEAAVLKGVYLAVGGSSAIAIPSTYSMITAVSFTMAKAKVKFRGSIKSDGKKLVSIVSRSFSDLVIVFNSDVSEICIFRLGEIVYRLQIKNKIYDTDLTQLGGYLLSYYGDKIVNNDISVRIFYNALLSNLMSLDL